MRNALQITLAIVSLIPLAYGVSGVFFGVDRWMPGETVPAGLDSHYRFLSAYYISLAFLIWWVIPHIERHTTLVRIICLAIFLGGLSRVWSVAEFGLGPLSQTARMALELSAPLIALWQAKVAQAHDKS